MREKINNEMDKAEDTREEGEGESEGQLADCPCRVHTERKNKEYLDDEFVMEPATKFN